MERCVFTSVRFFLSGQAATNDVLLVGMVHTSFPVKSRYISLSYNKDISRYTYCILFLPPKGHVLYFSGECHFAVAQNISVIVIMLRGVWCVSA